MKKFSLITILALFLCAISVYALSSFKIVENSVNLAGKTTDSPLQGDFQVNNTGTEDLAIEFTDYELSDGTNFLYITNLDNIINLGNGTTQPVTFSVVIPDQQTPGLYTGTLTATSNASIPTDSIIINVDVTPTYSVSTDPESEMNLGSASLNTTYTKTFDITNTGNDDITNVNFDFSDTDFDFQANKSNFILAVDATETIKFNITIPADYSTGNLTLGSVNLDSSELNIDLFGIEAEVGGGLIIEDLDVFLTTRIKRGPDGILRSDSGSDIDVYDGRSLNFDPETAGPESEIRFNFNIENTFTDKDNVDINDISIKVTIEEIDDGEDIEEESDEFDLDPDSSRDTDVIIRIPLSVNVGVYDIIIDVEGEDDNGNKHTAQMNLEIDIDKEPRDVIISEASLFPEKLKCSGSTTLTATIKNIGKRIEDHAKLEITNKDLNINVVNSNIILEEDPFDEEDEFTKRVTINVDKNTEAKRYPISVKAYLQEEILWETKIVYLTVEACSGVQEEIEEDEVPEEEEEEINETEIVENVEEEEEEITEGEETPVLEPVTTTEVPLTKRPAFWFLIIALNIIVIAVVALLVVKIIERK